MIFHPAAISRWSRWRSVSNRWRVGVPLAAVGLDDHALLTPDEVGADRRAAVVEDRRTALTSGSGIPSGRVIASSASSFSLPVGVLPM